MISWFKCNDIDLGVSSLDSFCNKIPRFPRYSCIAKLNLECFSLQVKISCRVLSTSSVSFVSVCQKTVVPSTRIFPTVTVDVPLWSLWVAVGRNCCVQVPTLFTQKFAVNLELTNQRPHFLAFGQHNQIHLRAVFVVFGISSSRVSGCSAP